MDAPPPAPRWRRCCRAFARAACSQPGLLVLVAAYVLLGAKLFEYLEAAPENVKRSAIQRSREECLKELWAITERLNVLYERNWTRLVHEQLRKFETSIVTAARAGTELQAAELATETQWNFPGALLYCITLITTVGYGNVTPRTAAGRAATVAYAAAGVPLALACLAGLGAALARRARAGWLRTTTNPAWKHRHEQVEDHLQLHEHQRLLHHGDAAHNQYTALPPAHVGPPARASPSHIVHGTRACSQVFERDRRAHTLGRVKRNALNDEAHTSHGQQTQTLDRKRPLSASPPCLATVHHHRPKSRFQPRPMTPEIRQLIAEECGEVAASSKSDLDESDEVEEDGLGVYGTPSRVPLLVKSSENSNNISKTCSSRCHSSLQDGQLEHSRVPASLVLLLLTGYICGGAFMFSAWGNWSFLDAAYFCFIALATIGFGDFAPNSLLVSKTENTRTEYLQMFACCAYLVFGLILIAMAFSLLQDEVVAKCNQLANSLGFSKH